MAISFGGGEGNKRLGWVGKIVLGWWSEKFCLEVGWHFNLMSEMTTCF